MRQVLLRIPVPGTDHVVTLYGYGLAMCLGFLAAIFLAARRARRDGQSPDVVYNAALFAFFGGILGARLFFVVQYSDGLPRLSDLVKIWEGGLTFYGGYALAAVAVAGYIWMTRRPVAYWLDVFTPSVALGEGFGRLGCFLNGCCFGDICRHGWGITWPPGTIPWHHFASEHLATAAGPDGPVGAAYSAAVGALASAWDPPPIHPSQLYSFLNAVLLAAVLYGMLDRKRRHGQVVLAFCILYGISRFMLELLRADEAEVYLLGLPTVLRAIGMSDAAARLPGLTISQNIAIAMVVGGAVGMGILWRSRSPRLQAAWLPPPESAPAQDRGGPGRKNRRR